MLTLSPEDFDALKRRDLAPLDKYVEECTLYAVAILRTMGIMDADLTEEIVQEAFTELIRDIHKLRKKGAFKAFWAKIVWRTANRVRKAQNKRQTRQTPIIPDELVDSRDSTGNGVILPHDRKIRRQKLLDAIAKLPPRQRDVVLLFYFAGLSIKEIAGVLGTSENAVRVALATGRARLKLLLQDDDIRDL